MVQLLLPVAVLACGLAAGGLMISVLGGAPLLLVLPTDRYIPVHQFLVQRFDPFMPISMGVALLCDVALVFLAPTSLTRSMAAVAAVLLLLAMAVSIFKNVPINKWVATLSPDTVPDDWERLDPRVRWRNWNAVRTVFAVAALTVNVAAVGVLL
jgi:uncharacterized membrane protein